MNKGFSAAADKNIFGTIAGLTPKTYNDGKTSNVAECPDEYGDTAAHDVYGEVIAPSVEFVVTAAIAKTTTLCVLGSIHDHGGKKIMLTTCGICS